MLRRYLLNKPVLSIVIIVLGFGFALCNEAFISGSSTGCVVTNKFHFGTKNQGNVIYAKGCNGNNEERVFSVKNNWFAGQFASGDTYDKIEIGQTYDFETRGLKRPFQKTGENIVGITESSR